MNSQGALKPLSIMAPAKINLMLRITGKREDGFHEILSLVAPISLHDKLQVSVRQDNNQDTFTCNHDNLPVGDDNLILRASNLFKKETGINKAFDFQLQKNIPIGAGLGGGSSNAIAVLSAMQQLCEHPLTSEQFYKMASQIGSDCPLFIRATPCILKGRGEKLDEVPKSFTNSLNKWKIVLFKPSAEVSTKWAYAQIARKGDYSHPSHAENELNHLLQSHTEHPPTGSNDFESAVFSKFLALKHLVPSLREQGYTVNLSGSGSACFVIVPKEHDTSKINKQLIDTVGDYGLIGEFDFLQPHR